MKEGHRGVHQGAVKHQGILRLPDHTLYMYSSTSVGGLGPIMYDIWGLATKGRDIR